MRLAYRGADRDLARAPRATQELARWVSVTWPQVLIGSSYRPNDPYRDHREGALDIMTGDKATHDAICEALIREHNAGGCRVVSLISWRRRWTPTRGWHKYTGSLPHTDHVHAWIHNEHGFRGRAVPPQKEIIESRQARQKYPLGWRGGRQAVFGPRSGPAHYVGGYHESDRKWIRMIQAALRADSWPGLAVDGIYGPATEATVRRFQELTGLQVDGLVGPQTWARLFR